MNQHHKSRKQVRFCSFSGNTPVFRAISLLLLLLLSLSVSLFSTNSYIYIPAELIQQEAVAQTNNSNFLIYDNPAMGLRIQYPPNFEIMEIDKKNSVFHTPLEAGEEVFSEQFGILTTDAITGNDLFVPTDMPVNDYLLEQINNYADTYTDLTLVEGPSDMMIDGHPAKRAVFKDGETRTMNIWTADQNSGKVFQFEITVKGGKYSEFPPPHIQKMIDSIEITPTVGQQQGLKQQQEDNMTFGENATLTSNITKDINISTNQTVTPFPSSFVNYENTTYGIRMQYPTNWEKQEYVGNLIFLSPPESNTDTFREGLGITIQSTPSEGMILDNFVNTTLDSLEQTSPSLQVIDSFQTNLANSVPAHLVEYTWTNPQNNIKMKTMEVYAIANGKSYIISYGAPQEKYDLYRPTIQSMISSINL